MAAIPSSRTWPAGDRQGTGTRSPRRRLYKDEVVYLGGFGAREMTSQGKVDADTVFHLASLGQAPLGHRGGGAGQRRHRLSGTGASPISIPPFKLHDAYPTEKVK